MNRDDVIARIKKSEPAIRAFGAQTVYLFGSTARNEATAASDVDIFIDSDPKRLLGFLEFFGLEELLEDTLGAKVDLCTRPGLHPALRADIEQSAIRIL